MSLTLDQKIVLIAETFPISDPIDQTIKDIKENWTEQQINEEIYKMYEDPNEHLDLQYE